MIETSGEVILNLVCRDIREAGFLAEDKKKKLTNIFGNRFTTAYKALQEMKVRKYVFSPSGRVVWIVAGKDRDYQILPLVNYCSCFDFYFRVIGHETSFYYHLITQKLSEALEKYVVVEETDTNFRSLMEKWRKVPNQKRALSPTEVERIRRIAVQALLDAEEITIDRLLGEMRAAGFILTVRHLVNILISDKQKRFKHVDRLWKLTKFSKF